MERATRLGARRSDAPWQLDPGLRTWRTDRNRSRCRDRPRGARSGLAPCRLDGRLAGLLLGVLLVGRLVRNGNAIRLACPRAEVDQAAALGAERTKAARGRPCDGRTALRACHRAFWRHDYFKRAIGRLSSSDYRIEGLKVAEHQLRRDT